MPPICVCCGGQPDTYISDSGFRQGKARGGYDDNHKSVGFPACARCVAHHARDTSFFRPFKAAAPRSASCEAVECLADFIAYKGTEQTFRFDSPRFTHAFVEANRAAGKNIIRFDLSGAPTPPAWSAPTPPAWSAPTPPAWGAPAGYAPMAPAGVGPGMQAAPAGRSPALTIVLAIVALCVACFCVAGIVGGRKPQSAPQPVPVPPSAPVVAPEAPATAAPQPAHRAHQPHAPAVTGDDAGAPSTNEGRHRHHRR